MKKFITSRFNILARILHDWLYVFQLGGPKNPDGSPFVVLAAIDDHCLDSPFNREIRCGILSLLFFLFFLVGIILGRGLHIKHSLPWPTLYRKSKISFYSSPLFTSLNNEFIAYYPLNMITEIFYFNISLNSLI